MDQATCLLSRHCAVDMPAPEAGRERCNASISTVSVRQSSTAHGGAAARAVDGNTNDQWAGGSCTHTFDSEPWWQMRLLGARRVEHLVITPRGLENGRHNYYPYLRGAQAYVSNSSKVGSGTLCGTVARDYSGPSFAYSLPVHSFHTRRDRVASLKTCRLYGAAIQRASPLGPGRALTLPCGWNIAVLLPQAKAWVEQALSVEPVKGDLVLKSTHTPFGTGIPGPSRAEYASRSLRRALLLPPANAGSRYRDGEST